MNVDLREMTIGIESNFVTPTSANYRVPSWPPPRDWPVVIDKHGAVVSRWGDPRWTLTPWTGHTMILNFGDGDARTRKEAYPLDAENANLMRMVATWLIWGPQAARAPRTVYAQFYSLRNVVALCSRNGINAARLMRFPKVFEQVPEIMTSGTYAATITLLHRLYDARDVLGFTIVDSDGLKRLVAAAPYHDRVQTPYIPPRIWLYQVTRLRECLADFLAHQKQAEACFQFCLGAYIDRFGSLEAALVSNKKGDKRGPFNPDFSDQNGYPGTFREVAVRFGIAEMLAKWVAGYQSRPDMSALSAYFSVVTFAGLAYVCNFTLQRREEVSSLRSSCLLWDEDEKLGRVPIICGETTKTAPDSDARWVASPSVEIAIQALSSIARLRMICDRANPIIQPTGADRDNPFLSSTPTEPWGRGLRKARPYNVRKLTRHFNETVSGVCEMLFDPDQLRVTIEDLEVARRLTPNLPQDQFAVGKVWPLAWHQYRRTGAVNMFASGDISDSTMQQQMKHSSRLMPLYYGRNHSRLHFNKEVQAAVVLAMYEAQARIVEVVATGDRFVSPHSPERKEALSMNVLSAKDTTALIAMAKRGTISFRENRLGGCMKAGACEYGGIESVARCAGGDGLKPCTDVLYDRAKESQVRAELRRVTEEIKLLSPGQPRYNALVEERIAMENYLNAVST
jgi:hypothetical protein